MVGGTNERSRGRILVRQSENPRQSVRQRENKDRLNEEGDRNPDDHQRFGQNHCAFEGEQQDQGDEQGADGDRREKVEKPLTKPLFTLGPHNPLTRAIAGHQRKGDIHANGQQQGLPGDRQTTDPEEYIAQHTVQDEHGQGINRDHDKRQPIIALGQIAPDQDHGRTGCDAQQDTTRQIAAPQRHLQHLDAVNHHDGPGAVIRPHRQIETERHLDVVNGVRADEIEKEVPEKKHGNRIHGEGFDGPIDKQGESNRTDALPRSNDLGKVDFDHDGVHHEKQTDRNRNRDHRRVTNIQGEPVKKGRHTRCDTPQTDARGNAQQNPDGQVALKGTQPL